MGPPSPSPAASDGKKTRAKRACRVCNSRRVRCNVTEAQPCDNCVAAGAPCEIIPSRRGRYPRRSRRSGQRATTTADVSAMSLSLSPRTGTGRTGETPSERLYTASKLTYPGTHEPSKKPTALPRTRSRAASPSPAPAAGTLFFGESNFLTLVPGEQPTQSTSGQRLMFPEPDTPQDSQGEGTGVSPATMRYLREEGALTLPDLQTCVPALQAYFTWFHPCFPIVDRAHFVERLAAMDVSRLLLQAMLFIGVTYCDDGTVAAMGFADRSEAKRLLYGRARVLFHADWERDRMTLIQALFLMSFWRGGPSDVRDVRYWLGVVITLAESYGLHRSEKFMSKNPRLSRMRRRIWWSIYVRERQAAASLGLPSRIRDEDCDIEPLGGADLESSEADGGAGAASLFGSCQPQHITYAIKMVEIARLLGRVIDIQFVPGQRPATSDHVHILDSALDDWRDSLPRDMQYSEEDTPSIWTCLLHLAHNHLRVLIHRANFLKHGEEDKSNQIVLNAACRISRIAEDMSAQGILRYGQMHLITSLFAALCIHALSIRRNTGMYQRIAEHRARLCLLCLKEIQKYWRVNNNVLDLFLQYLDSSIAKRLHGPRSETAAAATGAAAAEEGVSGEVKTMAASKDVPDAADMSPTAATMHESHMSGGGDGIAGQQQQPADAFEDQYMSLINGHWEGDDALGDLGLFLRGDDFMQSEGMEFLGRSL